MKLSSDLLTEIAESVTVVGQDAPREADRRSPRVRLSSHLFAFSWGEPTKPFGIRVRDMSDGGVGILHHQRIALDEKLVVRFTLPKNQQLLVLGTVVYWEPLAEDLYAIGLQFDRIVEQAELESKDSQESQQGQVLSRLTQVFNRSRRVAG